MTQPLVSFPRADHTAAWQALTALYERKGAGFDLRAAFQHNPRRFEDFSLEAPQVFVDLSKNLLDQEVLAQLLILADQTGVMARRKAMWDGLPINVTEGRAVSHVVLRAPPGHGPLSAQVHEVLDRMLNYAESARGTIQDVVNIGIGGSDLGPRMVVQALQDLSTPSPRMHFVSNVDAHEILQVLHHLRPERTLFVLASKTFTTQETLANAEVAKAWFLAGGGRHVARHFVATTTNTNAAARFGIDTTFGFWDAIGGRYSLWSAIGLPIALAIGAQGFRQLLAGAHAMDTHFAEAAPPRNVPLLLGLLDVWYRNFHRFSSRCVAPYHHGLSRLPAYLQQLEMESNGKSVDLDGEPLPYATSPVVWGEPGTTGQHAFFQMLHQGTDVIPVEFLAVRRPRHALLGMHEKLLANCLAQSQALLLGKSAEAAAGEAVPTASPTLDPQRLARHRRFPGNRPSTTLLLEALTPQSLGALIALYEHRIFTSGAVWGINSFDQWGVELGKALCGALLPHLASTPPSPDAADLDPSTAGLLRRVRGTVA